MWVLITDFKCIFLPLLFIESASKKIIEKRTRKKSIREYGFVRIENMTIVIMISIGQQTTVEILYDYDQLIFM